MRPELMIALVPSLVGLFALSGCGDCPMGAEKSGSAPPNGTLEWCQKKDDQGNWVRHGPLKVWWPTGQLELSATFKNGQPNGKVSAWWPKGQRAFEGEFDKGQGQGTWRAWFANGKQAGEGSFKSGKKNGAWMAWDPFGKQILDAPYKDGSIEGVLRTQYSDTSFVNNLPDGKSTEWWCCGERKNKEREGEFSRGRRIGLWTVWWESGNPRAKVNFGSHDAETYSAVGFRDQQEEGVPYTCTGKDAPTDFGTECQTEWSSSTYIGIRDCCLREQFGLSKLLPPFFIEDVSKLLPSTWGNYSGIYKIYD